MQLFVDFQWSVTNFIEILEEQYGAVVGVSWPLLSGPLSSLNLPHPCSGHEYMCVAGYLVVYVVICAPLTLVKVKGESVWKENTLFSQLCGELVFCWDLSIHKKIQTMLIVSLL